MDDIYKLYCKILEQTTKMEELVPENDGIILKMHRDILIIQYETLLNLMEKEAANLREKYNEFWKEKYAW